MMYQALELCAFNTVGCVELLKVQFLVTEAFMLNIE